MIVFPAGEVARLGLRGVTDGRWRRGFLRFARASDAPVLPVRIEARNSALFYGASALFKPAGTALLAREMFARRARRIALRIGTPLHAARRRRPERTAAAGAPRAVCSTRAAQAVERHRCRSGAGAADRRDRSGAGARRRRGAWRCWARPSTASRSASAACAAGSPLLREIGRLRELTFRAVGEGTGQRLDVDLYDSWYEHIVLWDDARIADRRRLPRSRAAPRVLAERGLPGLYTASLFHYRDDAMPRIAQGMELGRSFVAPEYWGSRSIDYLWQGIGAYLARHPQRALPVRPGVDQRRAARSRRASRSSPTTRAITAALMQCAESKQPFVYRAAPPQFGDGSMPQTAFRVLKANLDALGADLADALQAVHRSVRAGRRALPRVRCGSGFQRCRRRPDRSRPASPASEEARALSRSRRSAADEHAPRTRSR